MRWAPHGRLGVAEGTGPQNEVWPPPGKGAMLPCGAAVSFSLCVLVRSALVIRLVSKPLISAPPSRSPNVLGEWWLRSADCNASFRGSEDGLLPNILFSHVLCLDERKLQAMQPLICLWLFKKTYISALGECLCVRQLTEHTKRGCVCDVT